MGAAARACSRACSGCAGASWGCGAGSRSRGSACAGPALRAAAVALTLIVALGGFVFYNTNVLNDVRDADEIAARQAEYERRYKRFEDAPAPSLVAARLRVELYPAGARRRDRAARSGS